MQQVVPLHDRHKCIPALFCQASDLIFACSLQCSLYIRNLITPSTTDLCHSKHMVRIATRQLSHEKTCVRHAASRVKRGTQVSKHDLERTAASACKTVPNIETMAIARILEYCHCFSIASLAWAFTAQPPPRIILSECNV